MFAKSSSHKLFTLLDQHKTKFYRSRRVELLANDGGVFHRSASSRCASFTFSDFRCRLAVYSRNLFVFVLRRQIVARRRLNSPCFRDNSRDCPRGSPDLWRQCWRAFVATFTSRLANQPIGQRFNHANHVVLSEWTGSIRRQFLIKFWTPIQAILEIELFRFLIKILIKIDGFLIKI